MDVTSTVLIVDDYADALEVWEFYLSAVGFSVRTAKNGAEALAIASSALPDVIVMDIELPGMSGLDVARRLRAADATRGIPLIAATGNSHTAQIEQIKLAGFDAILIKPCPPDTLLAEIRRLVPQRQ